MFQHLFDEFITILHTSVLLGLVVDQDALVDALQRKVIRAAALDVTYPEPLPRFAWLIMNSFTVSYF